MKMEFASQWARAGAKRLLCLLLVLLTVLGAFGVGESSFAETLGLSAKAYADNYTYTYYPKCAAKYTSIVDALKSVGAPSDFSSRKSIAALNGINNYSGTAAQNKKLLNLLKQGKLVKSKTNKQQNDWVIQAPSSVELTLNQKKTIKVYFKGTGINEVIAGYDKDGIVKASYSTEWKPAGSQCISTFSLTGVKEGSVTLYFILRGSRDMSKAITIKVSKAGTPAAKPSNAPVKVNLSNINYIKQGSKTCKASSVAMALNILTGKNTYTTNSMGGSCCTNIQGKKYTGSNGCTYTAVYKQDSYVGSESELKNEINRSLSAGVPIVIAVHSTAAGKTRHHWIVVVGKSGNDYLIVDPASGSSGSVSSNTKTMSAAKYAFGLTDYATNHYGYVSFKKA